MKQEINISSVINNDSLKSHFEDSWFGQSSKYNEFLLLKNNNDYLFNDLTNCNEFS